MSGTTQSREHSWLHHRLCEVNPNHPYSPQSGWINEVIEDLDQGRVVLAKPKEVIIIA
jgi:hypothetical protein